MSYRVAWRAAPAPFPLGSYRLAGHQLNEREKQNKQKNVCTIFKEAKAEVFNQLHFNTSTWTDCRLRRVRTGRDGQRTLIMLYCSRRAAGRCQR